jgi:hypothetical protein
MSINCFKKDLAYGKKFEQLSLQYIPEFTSVEFAPDECFTAYDFRAYHVGDVHDTKYEVKTDRSAIKTGNFFIETNNKYGKPSGLMVTESDYYILISADGNDNIVETYIIPTETLREFNNKNMCRRVTYPSHGYLLPKTMLDKEISEVAINQMLDS